MSEKLNLGGGENIEPSERFKVDAEEYPLFARQAIHEYDGDKTLGVDETLGIFVRNTADLIATIDGTGEGVETPPADEVVYLDKSARPVSWLVNNFWEDFSEKERPEHKYLAIDRRPWFQYAGVALDSADYVMGTDRVARPEDFKIENIPFEYIARIRALFLKDGIEEEIPGLLETPGDAENPHMNLEDMQKIMQAPTGLEGKNIMVVDEVERSGSTLHIAQELLKAVLPEAASVNGAYFVPREDNPTPGRLMRFVPVWYDRNVQEGRGIGDVDPMAAILRYQKAKAEYGEAISPRFRARALGAFALGTAYDLSKDRQNKSRELAAEIVKMHEDFEAGKVLMRAPEKYNLDKYVDWAEQYGVEFVQDENNPKAYVSLVKKQEKARK